MWAQKSVVLVALLLVCLGCSGWGGRVSYKVSASLVTSPQANRMQNGVECPRARDKQEPTFACVEFRVRSCRVFPEPIVLAACCVCACVRSRQRSPRQIERKSKIKVVVSIKCCNIVWREFEMERNSMYVGDHFQLKALWLSLLFVTMVQTGHAQFNCRNSGAWLSTHLNLSLIHI